MTSKIGPFLSCFPIFWMQLENRACKSRVFGCYRSSGGGKEMEARLATLLEGVGLFISMIEREKTFKIFFWWYIMLN